ncbi:hypothetical protein [Paenibacillus fonticola]|uniref:hypothetical protein n=1 Tax=Paenibacillus fonticola TaxID=379896 RepID=UPI00038209AC|nr:hypothetical protein [Paenibacillus fonticola]
MSNRLIISLMAVAFLALSGCAVPSMPGELISAPNVGEHVHKEDEFRASLLALLPEEARLPTASDQVENSISYGDLDGDGTDEAVVVYELDGHNARTLTAALLMRKEEAWQIVWQMEGHGYSLDYSAINDVDQDGLPEILLGWSLGADVNGLDIYEWDHNTLRLQDRRGYHGNLDLSEMR